MATKARFKFNDRGLPWQLEQKLIFKYGFSTDGREAGDYVIFRKDKETIRKVYIPDSKRVSTPASATDVEDTLSALDETLLRRQLSAVPAMFLNVEANLDKIKVRLNNIKQIQPPKKAEFVQAWIDTFLEDIGDQ